VDGKLNLNLNLNPNLKPPQEVEGAMYAFPKIDLPPAAIEAAEEAGQVCVWGVCVRGTSVGCGWVSATRCVWLEWLELVYGGWF
jgi:hypothetical protein